MVLIIVASCLFNAVNRTPHRTLLKFKLTVQTFSKKSLSLNNNCENNLNLQLLLRKPPLNRLSDLISWHDVINNSITPHHSNKNQPLSIDKFSNSLKIFEKQLTAIVYNRRFGTPDLFDKLVQLNICPILSVKRQLISHRKRTSYYYQQQLQQIHPSSQTEINLLRTVLRHKDRLDKLTLQKRSKSRKRKSKKKSKK